MRRRDILAAWAVLATVTFGVFALGSSTRLTALITAGLGLCCALPYLRSRRAFGVTPPLVVLIAVAAAATAMQLLPLPMGLVAVLSPEKATLIQANAAALGESGPGWLAISMDPAATLAALASLLGYIGVAVAAIRISGTSRGRMILARGLVCIATAIAVVAVLHEVIGARSLFGIYAPKNLPEAFSFLAPLMNPNHLSGFLAVATPIAVALAVATLGPQRLAWAAAGAICASVGLLVRSRTGGVALLVGLAVVASIIVFQKWSSRRQLRRDRANRVAVVLIISTLFLAALAYFGGGVAEEIADTEIDEITGERGKLSMWRSSTALLWEHKIVGIGRGSFEQAFTPRLHSSRFRYSHVENEYLQAAIDWGLPIAFLMLALLGVAARAAARRAPRSLIEAGLFAALVAAAVHHLADFAIELPGVATFVLVAFAALSRTELTKAEPRRGVAPVVWRGALVGVAAILCVFAATPLARPARADSAALSEVRGVEEQRKRALEAWRRHPADYIVAGQAADALRRSADPRAFRVASRALAMNPTHWQLHLTVARMLLQTDRPEQALGEYRLAAEYAPNFRPIISEMITRFSTPELAVRGLPRLPRAIGAAAVTLRRDDAHAIGLVYARSMAVEFPDEAAVHIELCRFAYNRREWLEAVSAGQRALALGHRDVTSIVAKALIRAEQPADAAAFLDALRADAGAPPASSRQTVSELRVLAQARIALEQPALAVQALESALDTIGRRTSEAVPVFLYLAEIQEKMGATHQAAENRKAAARLGSDRLNDTSPPSN